MPLGHRTPTIDASTSWPDRQGLKTFFCWGVLLTIEWVIVYCGANWIAGLHSYRAQLTTDIDRQIPFVPAAASIYLSLFPLLWLAPLVLRTSERLTRFAVMLAWLIALSGIGFLLFPSEYERNLDQMPSTGGAIFQFADRINLTYNCLPSLHAGLAIACACAYGRETSKKARTVFSLWAAAIALSTLLTHQHYVVDVAIGGAMAFLIERRFLAQSPEYRQF